MSFVAFNPDGTKVASDAATGRADVSGDLTLWSFPDGRLIRKLHGTPSAISADWKYFATAHGVIETETGRALISLKEREFAEFAFSPDSRYVAESAAVKTNGGRIHIIDLSTGQEVRAFGQYAAQSMAISPDGRTLAVGYWNSVALWDLATGERKAVLSGFGRYVDSLAYSKDGSLLACGTDMGTLQIWDVQRLARLQSIAMDGGFVSNPAFSPDGRLVAVGVYGTGTVFLIDVHSGRIADKQKISDLGCGSVAFSPDGRYLITPSTGGLVRWPYDRGGTVRVFEVVAR
jgi:WD40 repeat protein